MVTTDTAQSDAELFAELIRRRAQARPYAALLSELLARWRRPARVVVERIQASYRRGSPADAEDVFQEATEKLLERGLDQFRGLSERLPGEAASPRSFFLRIVKHAAIDRYRRQREDLAPASEPGEERTESLAEVSRAVDFARGESDRREAQETYWESFRRLEQEHPNEATAWDLYHHQEVGDHPEIARRLGITVVNSYKRVSRAQAYLRLYLLESAKADA